MKLSLRNRQPQRAVSVAWLCLTVIGINPQHGLRLWAEETKARHTLQGHTSTVTSVAFSTDGKTLASASHDGALRLWEVATGKERAALGKYTGCVGCVAISPDGKTLASGTIGSPVYFPDLNNIKLWDVATGKVRTTLKGHEGHVHSVAFSPDGKTLASVSNDQTVKLWEMTTGKERATLQGHTPADIASSEPVDPVMSVVFSPDGKTLAAASHDKTVKVWDVATGKRTTFQGHIQAVYAVAFSPDGKTLASASDDKTVKLWDMATGKERVTCRGHTQGIISVAFSPDGKTVASASQDKTVKLWEVATGKERATINGHTGPVFSVAFSPDGKTLASASRDQTVKLWDMLPAKKTESARAGRLSDKDLDGLWTTLAGEDAAKAYQAIGTLVGVPSQAVPLVKERLRPVSKPNTPDITRLITDLDSDQFAVREKATEELEKKGDVAEAALRTKLAEKPSLEVRQRIERLLSRIERQPTPKSLRAFRAVELLEYIGSSEAKKVLEMLATGAEGARLTQEARASLARLNKRVVGDKR